MGVLVLTLEIMNNTKNMNSLIKDAADLIGQFNPKLAECFIGQPFRRVDLACAFSAGFAKSDSDDINSNASLVIRVALLDRDQRRKLIGQ